RRAHARGGPRPLRPGRVGRGRARRRHEARRGRAPCRRRAPRARPRRPRTDLDDGGGQPRGRAPRRPRDPARVVGAEDPPQPAPPAADAPPGPRPLAARPAPLIPPRVRARSAQPPLPGRAATAIRDARIDALMCHWALVTRRLVTAIDDAGGALYVWAGDDPEKIAHTER